MLPEEAAEFSVAMLRDMLNALAQSTHVDKVAIITDDDEIAALTDKAGQRAIFDDSNDLCAALHHGVNVVVGEGATTVLVLPGDLPTISAEDIDTLLAQHSSGLSLCPAIRDGGTNALVCTPPDAIEFCFGNDSARRHMTAAEKSGIEARRLAMSAFFRDIDLPDDLVWLNNQSAAKHSLEFLRQSGISARLGPASLSASA